MAPKVSTELLVKKVRMEGLELVVRMAWRERAAKMAVAAVTVGPAIRSASARF